MFGREQVVGTVKPPHPGQPPSHARHFEQAQRRESTARQGPRPCDKGSLAGDGSLQETWRGSSTIFRNLRREVVPGKTQ